MKKLQDEESKPTYEQIIVDCGSEEKFMEMSGLKEVATKLLYEKYPYHPPQDSEYYMFLEGIKWQAKECTLKKI